MGRGSPPCSVQNATDIVVSNGTARTALDGLRFSHHSCVLIEGWDDPLGCFESGDISAWDSQRCWPRRITGFWTVDALQGARSSLPQLPGFSLPLLRITVGQAQASYCRVGVSAMGSSTEDQQPFATLFRQWRDGDQDAVQQLIELLYPELHRLASKRLRDERRNHTLQPTELINEALLKVFAHSAGFQDRGHFFAIAARCMRQVLVDHARTRSRAKRGGDWVRCTLDEAVESAADAPERIVELDLAIAELAKPQPRTAEVIVLHYFGGMSYLEIATALSLSERSVSRELRFGKAWLGKSLGSAPEEPVS